jgi:hypothetical protein
MASTSNEETNGFAAALALQEAAARPGLPKKEVARLLEKVGPVQAAEISKLRSFGEKEQKKERGRVERIRMHQSAINIKNRKISNLF